MLVNDEKPVAPYVDAHAVVSPNGVFLVPTRIRDGSFTVSAATALQAQYLGDVAPYNAALAALHTALRLQRHVAIDCATTALISAIDTSISRLGSQNWPPTIAAAVAALIQMEQRYASDLRAWAATGPETAKGFVAATADIGAAEAVNQIRSAIGLPPVRK
jgi:hypothetical protein